MENKKETMKDDIEIAVMYVLDYCKKHGVYAYNDYMERSFNDSLMRIIRFHHTGSTGRTIPDFLTILEEIKEKHVFKK